MIEKKRLFGFDEISQHEDTDKLPVLQNGNKVTTMQKLKNFVINALSGLSVQNDFDNLICEQNNTVGKITKQSLSLSLVGVISAVAENIDIQKNKVEKIEQLATELEFPYNFESRNLQLELVQTFNANQEYTVDFVVGSPTIGDIMHVTHANPFEFEGNFQLFISEVGTDYFKFYIFAESGSYDKGLIFNITFASNEPV
jgi:hypothetical protein